MTSNKLFRIAGVLALGAAIGMAQAADLFSDNFDSNTPGLNQTPAGWTIGNGGTVDVIGAGTTWDFFNPAPGYYIDLNGTTRNPGSLLSAQFTLDAGTTYVASFDLAGNQRINVDDVVTVSFGDLAGTPVSQTYSLQYQADWTHFQLLFTPVTTGAYGLSFLDTGNTPNDNVGLLLDNVRVAAVPEADTWALLLAGLGLLGFMSRRRLS